MTVPGLIKEKLAEFRARWRPHEAEVVEEWLEEALQEVADLAYKKGKKAS